MEIGSIIFDLRKSKKLSQRQLSEIVGVSEDTIYKWEEDKELPDIASLMTLSKYFGVTVDYIFMDVNSLCNYCFGCGNYFDN